MSLEIELKLCLDQPKLPPQLAKLLENNHNFSKKILGNCYYDTVDKLFFRHKSALRVRTIAADETSYILSLKQDKSDLIGLSARLEYEFEQLSPIPDLSLLASVEQLQQEGEFNFSNWYAINNQLIELFNTDFMRQSALIECCDKTKSALELSLDLGSISVDNANLSIKELEIELKNASVEDLHDFLELLQLDKIYNNFRLSNLSKAHRGALLCDFMADQKQQKANNFTIEIAKIKKMHADKLQDPLTLQLQLSDYFNFYYELALDNLLVISDAEIISARDLALDLENSKDSPNVELIKQLQQVVTATDFYQFWYKSSWFNLCLQQLLSQIKTNKN